MPCAQSPVALLTKLAILNNANVILVDAVIDALMITLIKDNDNLLGTINSYIKPPLKRYKTKAADSRYVKASRERTKKDKDLENSDTSSDVLRLRRRNRAAASQLKKTRDEEKLAKAKKEKEEKESLCKSRDSNRTLHSRRLTDAYILYFKELLSNNSRIFANAIGIGKTQAIVLAVLIGHFCFFSNSPLENIGRLTKEKAIEMRINTTNAIFKALTAANKLIILKANTPAVYSKATKYRLALLAARFIIVCSFRKVDKHIFRAYNTISVTAQQTIIRKGSPYIEKRAILLPSYITFNATNKRDSITSNCIYKIEDARNIIANIKHNASEHKSSYKDILEKEGLNKLEASRYVIFNCFKMQAIFKIYSSCKVKRFTLNSVKNLFTNLSKDYFLSIAAEDIAKAANILLLLKEVCAKILIELYKLIVQAIIVALIAFAEAIILTEATHVLAEICVSIVYFNLDSELELKVLSKQNVKITS
ncbi:hypothetical protein HBI42_237780 [Parastagonospora nodorum]|nr:hypothetical protein HBI43_236360 [Parastagonospora nodorum]KAH6242159.1 hypothetical protein HBI42_237780 [Parastagonospora nodorum]